MRDLVRKIPPDAIPLEQFALERGVVLAPFPHEADRGRGMHVQPAREQISDVVPPHDALRAEREHVLGEKCEHGLEMEFGVFQKAEQ